MPKLIRRVFVNKKNKQLSISIPKKQIKAMDPTVKFDKDLFVELRILKRRKKK